MRLPDLNGALLGVLVLGLVVPTGAVVTGTGGSDDVWDGNGIVLEPAPGPNGEYASVGGDGNLTVNLADPGVNLDAVTEVERIFVVRNTADAAARVWLTHNGSSRVTFTESATGEPVQGRAGSRVLGPGEKVVVGVHVDTRGPELEAGDALLESIRLHAEPTETQTTTTTPTAQPTPPPSTTATTTTTSTTTTATTTTTTTTAGVPGPADPEEAESVSVNFGPRAGNVTVTHRELSVDEIPEPTGDGDPRPTARITPSVEDGTAAVNETTPVRVNNSTVDAVTTAGEPLELEGDQSLVDISTSIDVKRRIAKVVDIEVPQRLEDTSATVRIRLNRSRLQGTDPDRARIGHRTEAGWQLLETRVVERTDRTVTLQTRTPGFSIFAVFRSPSVRYRWTLQNGSTHTGPQVRSVLEEPGLYNVSLTVTDARGNTDTTRYRILANDRPSVRVDAPSDVALNQSVTLRADVSNRYGNVTVTWLLPDGRQVTGERVTTAFPRGEHAVEVRVRDEFGATATAERTISVGVLRGGPVERAAVEAARSPLAPTLGLVATLTLGYVALRRRSGRDRATAGRDWTWPWTRRRSPVVERLENPHWDADRGRFEIDRLAVRDPDDALETVEITVLGDDGRALARKTIDMRRTATYEATGERIPGIAAADLDDGGRYLVRVRAVDADDREGEASRVVDLPDPPPAPGTPAAAP